LREITSATDDKAFTYGLIMMLTSTTMTGTLQTQSRELARVIFRIMPLRDEVISGDAARAGELNVADRLSQKVS